MFDLFLEEFKKKLEENQENNLIKITIKDKEFVENMMNYVQVLLMGD
jgi:hypothetical protein